MDDLLIVRMSDRSKERFSRKRRKMDAPIGMNFGLIIGIGIGVVAASKSGADPVASLGIGVAFGIVFGGLAGRFFKPARRYQRSISDYRYEGMTFESEEEAESADSNDDAPEPSRS